MNHPTTDKDGTKFSCILSTIFRIGFILFSLSCYSVILIHSLCVTDVVITRTSNVQNMSIGREELLKALLIRKTIVAKGNAMETKPTMPFSDSKKSATISNNNQGGKELLKVVKKGTEKLSIKEIGKCKSGSSAHSKVCFCSPTTHEGSFRCRLHRVSAAKKSSTEKSNMRMCSKKGKGEFKPQLSRFGRVASVAEVGSHDNSLA